MRFDRYTIRGQEAIQNSIGVAEKNENQQVEPEHLLIAMLEQEQGVVGAIFGKIGANKLFIGEELEKEIAKFPKVKGGQQYFSTRVNAIFQEAQKEAEAMKDEYVSTEHLIMACADEKDGECGSGFFVRAAFKGR